MRTLIGACVLALLPTATLAQGPPIRDLIAMELELNSMCRGWSLDDEGHLDKICSTRDKLGKALNKMGYCYGKQHEAGYQMKWHRCTSASWRR
jgi:hypothetical protein